ncbi:MAG: XRE family transcriptional regulator [Pseudomonadota bacterium]
MSSDLRDAHELSAGGNDQLLQHAVGRQIRKLRHAKNLTVADLSRASSVSLAMISKIENGQTSASLNTLERIAAALCTSISSLFVQYEEHRDVSYVPAGTGLEIERRGTRAGHQYQLLGHGVRGEIDLEPYLVTLNSRSDTFPWFQHSGVEFLHILEGEMTYRIGDATYALGAGDSLFFDPMLLHGPEKLTTFPVVFLAIIGYERKV